MTENANSSLWRIERPDSVNSEVVRRLLAFLLSGEIAIGQRIPSERQLAESLGVGRSVIREALKPLQLLGLLDVRIGDGTYLKEADSSLLPEVLDWSLLIRGNQLLELIETRRYVEAALAGLAAERRSASELATLRAQVRDMRAALKDPEAFAESDAAFHFTIAQAAQNTVLAGLLMSLRSLLRVWIRRVLATPDEAKWALNEHRLILSAIQKRDRDGAQKAMLAHIDRVAARLRESLDQPETNAL